MTRGDIIKLAREAGFEEWAIADHLDELERFAALVAAHEREACAKVCEALPLEWPDQPSIAQAERATLMDCATAIRARSEE
jgi:hypothetical protein